MGVSFTSHKNLLYLTQQSYTEMLPEKLEMNNANPAKKLMDVNIDSLTAHHEINDEEKEEMSKAPYRELVRCLLYLCIRTRQDIPYAVNILVRNVNDPGTNHWNAAKRVLRYLRDTAGEVIHTIWNY